MVDTFLAHIRTGVELAAKDENALLIFSGGVTRPGVGPRSEGASYWLAADALDWFGSRASVLNRTHIEEHARDSMENLLFSVCRFRQLAGSYPRKVQVVSFGFKQARFEMRHRRAIRFPRDRFQFFGVDPPGADGMRSTLLARERAGTLGPFGNDPYACLDKNLHVKRIDRNPGLRWHGYPGGCPEISGLFRYCGKKIYADALPWDPKVRDGADLEAVQPGGNGGGAGP